MKRSKKLKEIEVDDIYYISLGTKPKSWFDIRELYSIINTPNPRNPITKKLLTNPEVNKIKVSGDKYLKDDYVSKTYDIIPLQERIEELENKLEKEINNNEQTYFDFITLREKFEKMESLIDLKLSDK